jgi:hypothetical protein
LHTIPPFAELRIPAVLGEFSRSCHRRLLVVKLRL